jgi:putative secretion ATPase (PEP-CTERM system associated)
MYERFHNLRERPFALSPDPEYLYPSGVHREALDHLRYGIESQAGFTVVTGEIGSGKTTLLQTLLQRLESGTTVARLVNTTLEPKELLEAILIDFGLEPASTSKPMLLRQLGEFLVKQRLDGRRSLLVVDEAQNLSPAALEEIRLLSNQETEKSKLVQIVLVGQPNLRETLAGPELEQLRQRITVSYHLLPLDAAETAAYINHRLAHAAIGKPMTFPRSAADLVHQRSRGVPRTINIICDAALMFGYAEERHHIEAPLVRDVIQELELTNVLPPVQADSAPAAQMVAPPPMPVARQTIAPQPVVRPAVTAPSAEIAATITQPRDDIERRLQSIEARLDAREAEVAAREAALARREREFAEQRRIMAEEYRLLHRARTQPVHAARPGASRTDRHAQRHSTSVWRRLTRLFAGGPAL